jgi:hypothetical protein
MSRLICLAIVLGCFSYPITTVPIVLADLPVNEINIVLKAGFAVVYFALLWFGVRLWGLGTLKQPLILFFSVYTIRLTLDIFGYEIQMQGYSTYYILAYFFLLTALPVVGIFAAGKSLGVDALSKWTLITLGGANLALIGYILISGTSDLGIVFSLRAQTEAGFGDTFVLGPLTFGLLGAALAAFTLSSVCISPESGFRKHAGMMALGFLGVINMFLGASRGPFIAFVLSVLVLTVVLFRIQKRTSVVLRTLSWVYLSVPIVGFVAMALSDMGNTFLIERLMMFFEDRAHGMREERDYQYENAFDDFLSAPLVGNHFVTSIDHFYPHNVPLEVLMAVGFVGGAIFLWAVVRLLISMFRIFRGNYGLVPIPMAMVAICFLFMGLTSGSVHSSPEFWIFFTLMTVIGSDTRRGAEKYHKKIRK